MKVLLAAPQSADTALGAIGLYCARALVKLGYETAVFDYRRSRHLERGVGPFLKRAVKKVFPNPSGQLPMVASLEREKMNKALSLALKEKKPDVLLVLLGDGITAATLQKARADGIITVNWFPDPVLAPTRRGLVEESSPFYDYFFMFDPQKVRELVKIGSRHVMTVPMACSPELHRRVQLSEQEKQDYGSDVAFIGTVKHKRGEVLASLADIDLGIWGAWQERLTALERCYRRKNVYGEEAVKIYNASKIVLDINESFKTGGEILNVTPRVFEATCSGAFLLTNENPPLGELYDIGREVVCYRDERDLKDKIAYFLAHPAERLEIAERGRKRACSDHTYEKRLAMILTTIERAG